MTSPSYNEYLPTPDPALGSIPSHWNAVRVRFLLRDGAGGIKIGPFGSALRLEEMVDDGLKVYGQENVINNDFAIGKRYISTEKFMAMRVYEVFSEDILITMMGTSGKCRIVPEGIKKGIIDSHLLRMRTNGDVVPKFFEILLNESAPIQHQIDVAGKGSIMHGLNSGIVKDLLLPVPPVSEQAAITEFLDRETAKIDTLIEKQERLIKLLEEKRQAVISHAVTRGLNPDVRMKGSGVEWLGAVPEHWTVRKIRHLAKLESGHTPSRNKPEYWEDCVIPWIALSDVWQLRDGTAEYISETKEKISILGMANSAARLLPKGTVILSRTASVGFSAIMALAMATTQDFANWVCGRSLVPEFLLYTLRAMKSEFKRLMMGSTHQTIYMPDIEAMITAVPPIGEQVEIVAHIRQVTRAIDSAVRHSSQAATLLRERRTALISAAVTGKIDVRDAV